ncbi:MAG: hypothetical protein ACKOTE_19170, partial [Opitutaceae bacterium]
MTLWLEMDAKIGQQLERYADFSFYIDYENWVVTFSLPLRLQTPRHRSLGMSRRAHCPHPDSPMLILYTTEDGKSRIQLRADENTVWLTQLEMADLFA